MAGDVRISFSCLTCGNEFEVHRTLQTPRCSVCGSMRSERRELVMDVSDHGLPAPELPRFGPEPESEPEPEPAPSPDTTPGDIEDVESRFACVNCAKHFVWNHTKKGTQDPTCAHCQSVEVVEISPRAKVIAVLSQVPRQQLTRSQVKRIKFIKRHWKMRCDLAEWIEGLENKLMRLGFEGDKANRARLYMRELLREVDTKQEELLEQFDGLLPTVTGS